MASHVRRQPEVTAEAIGRFLRTELVGGDANPAISAGGGEANGGSGGSPLARLNELLDRPLLDTSKPGGPLDGFKSFARTEPEAAQLVASLVAFGGFALVGKLLLLLAGF